MAISRNGFRLFMFACGILMVVFYCWLLPASLAASNQDVARIFRSLGLFSGGFLMISGVLFKDSTANRLITFTAGGVSLSFLVSMGYFQRQGQWIAMGVFAIMTIGTILVAFNVTCSGDNCNVGQDKREQ